MLFEALLAILELMLAKPEEKQLPISPELRFEMQKLDKYIKQQEFLTAYKLETVEELSSFIGTLQSNKVKYIIDKVSLIHSVDTVSLLEEISKRASKIGKTMDILIEVNSGKEESKGGIMPEDVPDFVSRARTYAGVRVRGLMTMAPRCNSREEYLKYFGIARALFDELFGNDKDAILSMGMSESYEYAIEAGATMVRVGSSIFGKRA